MGPLCEMAMIFGVTLVFLTLAQMFGRIPLRTIASSFFVISAISAYYMTRFKVIIGYGVMNAVITTDHDLSREVVGLWTLLWLVLFGLLPAIWFWRRAPSTGILSCWRSGRWWKDHAVLMLIAIILTKGGMMVLKKASHSMVANSGPETNLVGVTFHLYVPTNWIAASGMVLGTRVSQAKAEKNLVQPANKFHYIPAETLENTVVLLVIGETTRSDRMGLLGHSRGTTPILSAAPQVAAFRGWACDTTTKLSLDCMFVRPEGVVINNGAGPDKILEDNVFSVYKKLGFAIELFAMQSESGFYSKLRPDLYKLREVIAAQPENATRRLDDALLISEIKGSLARHSKGPLLIILHTKGSHFLYTERYPREYARWRPECMSSDNFCSVPELLNSFDNSVLYIDHLLNEYHTALQGRKSLIVFSSDHGESIDMNRHFHATPRYIAPPEQRRVPLLFWANDLWLADPVLGPRYQRLQQRARQAQQLPADDPTYGHHNLYSSLLGCTGIDSPDGGVTANLDLCH
jgi:KDO II ethanolaminephosphotransferase